MSAQIELDKVSKANLDKVIRGMAEMEGDFWRATVRVLFNIKSNAQTRLTDRGHVVTSRLKNSIYVKTPGQEFAGAAENNPPRYNDKDGGSYDADLRSVSLKKHEGAVGTNVEYGDKIERLDSYMFWSVKNATRNVAEYFKETVKRRANNKFLR